MKKAVYCLTLLLFSIISFGQQTIKSGDYGDGLKLAYDAKSKNLTGYYENYTGWDEQTKNPRFSCIFYIEGQTLSSNVVIRTYYPQDKSEEIIQGTLEIVDSTTVNIKLTEEHGGCWNVQHFADKAETFKLEKSNNWIQVRYINTNKSYFYKSKIESKKLRSYLIKNDIVFVEKLEGEWAFCTYFGKKTIKAWIKVSSLNKI